MVKLYCRLDTLSARNFVEPFDREVVDHNIDLERFVETLSNGVHLTILIATSGRPSLAATLASLRSQPLHEGDEVLLVHDGPESSTVRIQWEDARLPGRLIWLDAGPHHDWGHTPRNLTMRCARGQYLMHLDDDDCYAPGALAAVRAAITGSPGAFFLFQLRFPNGHTLWMDREIRYGNVGTPLLIHPTQIAFGTWGSFYGGDHHFIQETIRLNPDREVIWVPQVIALIRHNALQ